MFGAQRSILGARLSECSRVQLPSSLEQRMVIISIGSVCLQLGAYVDNLADAADRLSIRPNFGTIR